MLYYDHLGMIAMIPVIVLSLIIQIHLKSTYSKYSNIANTRSMTGGQMAEYILRNAGIQNVRVECVDGHLTDHYDPKARVVRLSRDNYLGTGIASVGVAAHECGHAIQHHEAYFPMKLRSAAVGITNFSSRLLYFLIIASMILNFNSVIFNVAIVCYFIIFLFQLITLPVEFNASSRAMQLIEGAGFDSEDVSGVRKVLTAAALTYVAATITALWQLLIMLNRRRR